MTVKLQPDIDKQPFANGVGSHTDVILFAVAKGVSFDFESQELVTHKGTRVKLKLYGGQRYPVYTIATSGKKKSSFLIHKLAGYLLFGIAALGKVHVRHLDGDVLNLSKANLAIGTAQQNESDKPFLVKSRAGKLARKAQTDAGVTSAAKKVSDAEVVALLRAYAEAKGCRKKLPIGFLNEWAAKLGLSLSGVQGIVRCKYHKQINKEVLNEQR